MADNDNKNSSAKGTGDSQDDSLGGLNKDTMKLVLVLVRLERGLLLVQKVGSTCFTVISKAISITKEAGIYAFEGLKKGGKAAFEVMKQGGKAAFEGIKQFGQGAFEKIKTASESVGPKIKEIGGSILDAAGKIKDLAADKIAAGWEYVVQATKQGLEEFRKYSSDYDSKMSGFEAANTKLQNSLGAAFAPIASLVLPFLTQAIDMVSWLADKAGQFTSALFGGGDTYTKSVTPGETAEGGETSGEMQFETAQVEGEIAAFADRVKEMMLPVQESLTGWGAELDFAPILESFEKLGAAIEPLVGTLFDGMYWFLENVLKPLGSWTLGEALPAFIDMISAALQFLNDVVVVLQPTFDYLWENILAPIGEFTGEIFLWAVGLITEAFGSLSEIFTEKGDKINAILQGLGQCFEFLWSVIIKPIIQYIMGAVGSMAETIGKCIGHVIDIFAGVIEFVSGVFAGDWDKAWNGIVDIFRGIFNFLIEIFEGAINAVINGLNAIHIKIPDWSPFFPGEEIGFNIPLKSFPRLATGAVLRGGNPFLAVVNDQPYGQTNVETPLATIEEALWNVMNANSRTSNVNIRFEGSLAELGRVLKPVIDAETARIGTNLLVMG